MIRNKPFLLVLVLVTVFFGTVGKVNAVDASLRDVYMHVMTSTLNGTELSTVYWDKDGGCKFVSSVPTGAKEIYKTLSEWNNSDNEQAFIFNSSPQVKVFVTGNKYSSTPITDIEADGLNQRDLVISIVGIQSVTTALITSTHYYVRVNDGAPQFLGNSEEFFLEWKPGGAGISATFANGPQSGDKYEFWVFGIADSQVVGSFNIKQVFRSEAIEYVIPKISVKYADSKLSIEVYQSYFDLAAKSRGEIINSYHIYYLTKGMSKAGYVGQIAPTSGKLVLSDVPAGEYEIFVFGVVLKNNHVFRAYESVHSNITISGNKIFTPTPFPTIPVASPTPTPTVTPMPAKPVQGEFELTWVAFTAGKGEYVDANGNAVPSALDAAGARVTIPYFGSPWDIGIYKGVGLRAGEKIEAGKSYRLQVKAKCSTAGTMRALVQENRSGAMINLTGSNDAFKILQVSLKTGEQDISVDLLAIDNNAVAPQITFWFGENAGGTFELKDFKLFELK
ncbi:MAG: hypothetical protein WCV41_00955 [Patescibacteria group bacterium]